QEVLRQIETHKGGWIAQAAGELQLKTAPETPATGQADARERKALLNQITFGEARVKKLRRAGDLAAAEKLQQRLDALKKRVKATRPAAEKTPTEKPQPVAGNLEEVVRQTYLRTISRYPRDDEVKRAKEYLAQSPDTVQALEDLLWVLLNTKEFQVNH
ncbi:MAG: hypothetical protein JJ992_30245, partial [Planctomycetes bacterium]|nr:hypothetical protein [Planctomycetota bacterium]